MPRMGSRREQAQTGNTLIASAMRMTPGGGRGLRNREGWQVEAWRFYDLIGELRYSANWVGNVCSRADFYAGVKTDYGMVERKENSPAATALATVLGPPEGQCSKIKLLAINLFVAGECYLVGRYARPERNERWDGVAWEVVSVEECHSDGTVWRLTYMDGLPDVVLDDTTEDVIRVWNSHPRKRTMADSPVRAQLENLRELLTLSRTVTAQARSRLAGAGLLLLPSEMTFTPPPDHPDYVGVQALIEVLGGAMAAAVDDPQDPSSLVPVMVSGPGDQIGNAKRITFDSEFDANLPTLRNECIRRLALGLDIPPEIMLGTADMNHWSAWQVEESSLKASIEPMLEAIAYSIAYGYVQDVTGNPEDSVGFDTSAIRLRPNRSREAIELWDRGELSGVALRRETGFNETDKPIDAEHKEWLLRRIASGSATPEMVADALRELGVSGVHSADQGMNQSRPSPSIEPRPIRDLPVRQETSLLDKSEVLLFRALERAGNRLRGRYQTKPPCSADMTYLYVEAKVGDLDFLLEDAWTVVPRIFPELPEFERSVVTKALDTYCRHLLLNKRPPERAEMQRYLTSVPVRSLVQT